MTTPVTSPGSATGTGATDTPGAGRQRRRTASRAALLALGLAAVAVVVLVRRDVSRLPDVWMVDFSVYYEVGQWARAGEALYAQGVETGVPWEIPYTYPPFAAALFVPLALLPKGVAVALWTTVNVLSLLGLIWLSLRMMNVGPARRRMLLTVAWAVGVLALDPILMSVVVGQVNIMLALLILLDLSGVVPERWRGVALGFAACIKLIPLIFIVYLLLTGRRSTAVRAGLTFAGCVAAGFALQPANSVTYWFDGVALDVSSRTLNGIIVNHSLSGLIARTDGTIVAPTWSLAVSAVVGVLGLVLAVRAHRRGHELLAFVVVGLTTLLISPITWPMHGVWVAPALVWLGYATWRAPSVLPRVAAGFLAIAFLLPLYELAQRAPEYQNTLPGNLIATFGGPFFATALALASMPLWLRHLRPQAPEDEPDGTAAPPADAHPARASSAAR